MNTETNETTPIERIDEARLPFFVYGTLRPHHRFASAWSEHCRYAYDGEATLTGFRLVTRGPFPFALPDASEYVVGCLVIPDEDRYEYVRDTFDGIEGYPTFYDRLMVKVDTPVGPTLAWVYSPARPDEYADLTPVPGNDWARWGE